MCNEPENSISNGSIGLSTANGLSVQTISTKLVGMGTSVFPVAASDCDSVENWAASIRNGSIPIREMSVFKVNHS